MKSNDCTGRMLPTQSLMPSLNNVYLHDILLLLKIEGELLPDKAVRFRVQILNRFSVPS